MSMIFRHGALSASYEEQANGYGYTLGEDAEWIQRVGYGLVMGHIRGCITDGEYSKILERFSRKVITKHLKPIADPNNPWFSDGVIRSDSVDEERKES